MSKRASQDTHRLRSPIAIADRTHTHTHERVERTRESTRTTSECRNERATHCGVAIECARVDRDRPLIIVDCAPLWSEQPTTSTQTRLVDTETTSVETREPRHSHPTVPNRRRRSHTHTHERVERTRESTRTTSECRNERAKTLTFYGPQSPSPIAHTHTRESRAHT